MIPATSCLAYLVPRSSADISLCGSRWCHAAVCLRTLTPSHLTDVTVIQTQVCSILWPSAVALSVSGKPLLEPARNALPLESIRLLSNKFSVCPPFLKHTNANIACVVLPRRLGRV